ncbi:MAG: hypothetical protein WC314_04070 [Vulcanimicrobiota bacterium]
MSITKKRLLLVSLSLLFTLICTEIGLRLTGLPKSEFAGWKAKNHPESELNQFGFRGKKLESTKDDFVVVLLGDSFVECVSSPIDKIPERLLEDELKALGLPAKVVSLGARGYGQDQQLLALREFFQDHRADLVLLWVVPDNDVWNNIFRTHYGGRPPKPTFRLEGDELVPPEWEWLKRLEPAGLAWAWRLVTSFEGYDKDWEKFLPPPYQPPSEPPGSEPDLDWQRKWDDDPYFRMEEFNTDRHHKTLHLEPRSERVSYGVRLTSRLLQEIQKLSEERGASFSILYTGVWEGDAFDRPIDDLHWYELNGKFYGYSMVAYWKNLRQLYDPFPRFIIPCTVEDWKVSEKDLHFNEKANAQLMKDLAAEVAKRLSLRG